MGINAWDVLIVGDGSGTGRDHPCGWCSILVDNHTRGRKLFYGGMSHGSVNLAELMPYYQALCWFDGTYGYQRIKERRRNLEVHVITDSQVTCTHGVRIANASEPLPKVGHRAMWATMREFYRLGYRIHWHWAPRSTSGLNYMSDLVAGLSRGVIKNLTATGPDIAQRAAGAIAAINICDPLTGAPITPYCINPDSA